MTTTAATSSTVTGASGAAAAATAAAVPATVAVPVTALDTGALADLRARAARVLRANWTGASTVPSRALYPHQWSWDSAFVAIGLRHLSPHRAQRELESLFAAQWGDGRVPHIVFNPAVPRDAYFPGPDFWRSDEAGAAAGAPRGTRTSGIVQPPVHALAAWLVHRSDPEASHRHGFLARLYPRLAAWHDYLATHRDLRGAGLASVLHPWETGMDNSPCWDTPLARVEPAPAKSFCRADLVLGAPADRPTDLDYGRYVRLAADYRDGGYRDGPRPDGSGGHRPRAARRGVGPATGVPHQAGPPEDRLPHEGPRAAAHPFAVEDPGFNALFALSEGALAAVAEAVGADPGPHRARARALTRALVEELWHAEAGLFLCHDVPANATLAEPSVSGLLPLALPGLPETVSSGLLATLGDRFGLGTRTTLVPSYALDGAAFDASRYWRGPAWFNTNWLVVNGLRRHGATAAADALTDAVLGAADSSCFAEYVDPYTGQGRGSTDFSWTAAVVLDLLSATGGPD